MIFPDVLKRMSIANPIFKLSNFSAEEIIDFASSIITLFAVVASLSMFVMVIVFVYTFFLEYEDKKVFLTNFINRNPYLI